jgi:DNA-binding beta-propeller fold protein YncE
MRLYVRDDFAWSTWRIGDPTKVRSPEEADPYLEGMRQLQAAWVLGPSGDVEWQLQRPRGLAIAPDGSLYVADSGGHRVYRLSPQGHLLASWGGFAGGENAPPGKFNEPWGLAVAPDGSVYVADTWNFRIQRFTRQGEFLDMWGSPGTGEILNALWGPRAVVVDEEGRVFVADTGNKRIVVFGPQGTPLAQMGGPGSRPGQFDEPVGLAIGPRGTLYVADTWNRRIQAFAQGQDGTFQPVASWSLRAWFGQSLENKPYLAVGPEGQVCTTDPEAARILCFDAQGNFLFGWALDGQGLGQPPLPVGIAISPQGHVWVSDSASGRLLGFLVDWPARVPEP